MATEKKYLSAEGLARYDALLKSYISKEISAGLDTISAIPEDNIVELFSVLYPDLNSSTGPAPQD